MSAHTHAAVCVSLWVDVRLCVCVSACVSMRMSEWVSVHMSVLFKCEYLCFYVYVVVYVFGDTCFFLGECMCTDSCLFVCVTEFVVGE